jgi:iron(III) transport system permease protein
MRLRLARRQDGIILRLMRGRTRRLATTLRPAVIATAAACIAGWIVLAGGGVAPLIGTILAVADPSSVRTDIVGTPPWGVLARSSLVLALVASAGSLLLGIVPAAVLGNCTARQWPWLLGLVLAPLIVPPQVYAYAWGLLPAGSSPPWSPAGSGRPVGTVGYARIARAGLISAGWLWPVVALVIATGWRSTGRAVYRLALLDASGFRAFVRGVLPALRSQVIAGAALVGCITLIEYPIPHLTLTRVWATELMVLVEVGAPAGQIVRMAGAVLVAVGAVVMLAALGVRGTGGWQPISDEDTTGDDVRRLNMGERIGIGWPAWLGAAAVWAATLGLPVVLMIRNLRVPGAWVQGLSTFSGQWWDSLPVAAAAGGLAILLAVATVGWWQASGRRLPRWAGILVLVVAAVPPPALGVGFVVVFNRAGWIGDLYAERPVVWVLSLAGRYGAVAVLLAWLALGRRSVVSIDQARVDGGGSLDVLAHVLLPMLWRPLAAAGLVVMILSLFEVVVTQMTRPPAYGSIAMTILNYMHYGRDDAVITSSLTLMGAGVLLMQV